MWLFAPSCVLSDAIYVLFCEYTPAVSVARDFINPPLKQPSL